MRNAKAGNTSSTLKQSGVKGQEVEIFYPLIYNAKRVHSERAKWLKNQGLSALAGQQKS